MTAGQNSVRETSACNSGSVPYQSVPYDVGYGRPPRHTQFQKGRSGNPGGRPRRDPVERLKALTLEQAYRTIVISRNGAAMKLPAIEAVLRSQIECAINGNVRAQCALIKSVHAFEREDAQAAGLDTPSLEEHAAALEEHAVALEEHIEGLVQQGLELERAIQEAKGAASKVGQETDGVAAAPQVSERPGGADEIERETAPTGACAPGKETDAGGGGVLAAASAETHTGAAHDARPAAAATPLLLDAEADAEEGVAAASVPSAGSAPQPEDSTAPAPLSLPDRKCDAPVQDDVEKDHVPAQRSAEIRKFPDKFPVLRETRGRQREAAPAIRGAPAGTRRMTARR
jgi:hypothetical protein